MIQDTSAPIHVRVNYVVQQSTTPSVPTYKVVQRGGVLLGEAALQPLGRPDCWRLYMLGRRVAKVRCTVVLQLAQAVRILHATQS